MKNTKSMSTHAILSPTGGQAMVPSPDPTYTHPTDPPPTPGFFLSLPRILGVARDIRNIKGDEQDHVPPHQS